MGKYPQADVATEKQLCGRDITRIILTKAWMWEEVNTVTFAEKLRGVMKEQNISQSDLSRLTKMRRDSVGQCLSDRNIPTPQRREKYSSDEASEDYFTAEENAVKACISRAKVKRLTLTQAARIMGMSKETLGTAIEEGKYSWGQVLSGKGKKKIYYINGTKLSQVECVDLGL